jgi:hypothetical protein
MGDKDILSKHIFKALVRDFATDLFGLPVVEVELLDTAQQRAWERRADLVAKAALADGLSFILYIEIQNDNFAAMPVRRLRIPNNMNKADLENLAEIRLQEAKALLSAECYPGAYYLAGYALECALKACIAKQVKAFDFPDKLLANDCYTHNLAKLLVTANLKQALTQQARMDENFEANWGVVNQWSEEARYRCDIDRQEAIDLFDAITNDLSGILPWLKKFF